LFRWLHRYGCSRSWCDLAGSIDGTADCSAGCTFTVAHSMICDLDGDTDGTADCSADGTFMAAYLMICDLDGDTDGMADCFSLVAPLRHTRRFAISMATLTALLTSNY
jgi:hypothetical protein